jgi:hypothetical protein
MKVANLTSGHAQVENENDSMRQKIGSCTKMKVHNARQYV